MPFFQANIVNGIQQQKLENADIIMELKPWYTQLKIQSALSQVESVSMLVFFDKEVLRLDKQNIDSSYAFQMTTAEAGGHLIIMSDIWDIAAGTALLTLKGEWDTTALSVSDILVTYKNGETQRLALGTRAY